MVRRSWHIILFPKILYHRNYATTNEGFGMKVEQTFTFGRLKIYNKGTGDYPLVCPCMSRSGLLKQVPKDEYNRKGVDFK